MYSKIVILLLALTGLVACHTPELVLDPSLTARAMPVKGRNGLQIGQVIRYGISLPTKCAGAGRRATTSRSSCVFRAPRKN